MAIQVTEKKKEVKTPKGLDAFLQLSVVLFFLAAVAYGLFFYLNTEAEEAKAEVERQIEETKAQIPEKEELERRAQEHFNLIEDFKLLSRNRRVLSPFFEPFENMIHPRVMIFSFIAEVDQDEARFSGVGEDLVAVGQQFKGLKNTEFVLNVSLSELAVIRREDGRAYVEFSFQLELDPETFKFERE